MINLTELAGTIKSQGQAVRGHLPEERDLGTKSQLESNSV